MWRGSSASTNEWTEFGEVNGDINGQTWQGAFFAYQMADGTYQEFAVIRSPYNGLENRHEFDIAREIPTPNYDDFNLDGFLVGVVQQSSPTSDLMEAGMETTCDLCSQFGAYLPFTSNERGMQTYAGGPTWYFWPSQVGDYNDTNATSNPVSDDYNPTGATTLNGQPCPLLTFF